MSLAPLQLLVIFVFFVWTIQAPAHVGGGVLGLAHHLQFYPAVQGGGDGTSLQGINKEMEVKQCIFDCNTTPLGLGMMI